MRKKAREAFPDDELVTLPMLIRSEESPISRKFRGGLDDQSQGVVAVLFLFVRSVLSLTELHRHRSPFH